MKCRTAAVAALVLLVPLSACGYEQGPAGRVVDKDWGGSVMAGSEEYRLTVRTAEGEEVEFFRVSSTDYHDCYRGSSYPACTVR